MKRRWLSAAMAACTATVGLLAFASPASAQDTSVTLPVPTSAPSGTVLNGPPNPVVTDANVAVGPNHIVEVGNWWIQVWNKSTRQPIGTAQDFSTWIGLTNGASCGDPRILYIPLRARWVASCTWGPAIGDPTGSAAVAVSTTSDPTGTWNRFNRAVPFMLDGPNLLATTDKFTIYGGAGNGRDALYVYPLDAVLSATAAFPAPTARNEQIPAHAHRAAVFQNTATNQSDGYLVGSDASQVDAWVVSGPPASPTISNKILATRSTPAPPAALIPGGGSITTYQQTGDAVEETRTDGHTVIAYTGNLACPSAPQHVCVFVDVYDLTDGTDSRTVVAGPSGTDLTLPAVGIDAAGNLISDYTYSSATIMPSAAVTNFRASGGFHVITGAGNPNAATESNERFGDYYSVSQDPSDGSRMWFVAQYQTDSPGTGDQFGTAVACATATAFGCGSTVPAGGPKVRYKNNDNAPGDNQIRPGLQLVNNTATAVPLSSVIVRYWFTRDGGANTFSTNCDYAAVNCTNVTTGAVNLATARTGANAYLQVGFTSGAGSLQPGASTGDLQLRLNKTDWSAFNENDDYSHGTNTSYADSTTITVYVNGQLVWGTEP